MDFYNELEIKTQNFIPLLSYISRHYFRYMW